MKLRNRKTGEIANLEGKGLLKSDNNNHIIVYPEGTLKYYAYSSLAELNEEWEDYEEPKKDYWYINDGGEVYGFSEYFDGSQIEDDHREIGNLFGSKEEAEKAVEKLKAWKRLKDKGFKLNAMVGSTFFCPVDSFISGESYEAIKDDLKIVFGGEE